jgi:hypothetical protein
MLYSQNGEKKADEVAKRKPYNRNQAKFLQENKLLTQINAY